MSTSYWSKQWEDVAKTPIIKTIHFLIDTKLIEFPKLPVVLDYVYKVSELKEFCKERGLITTGKKGELIERLITADETGMITSVKNQNLYICSEKGMVLAQDYINQKKKDSDLAKGIIVEALKKRDFKLASRTLINYEINQFFQRGLNVNWKTEEVESFVPTLISIFSKTPTVLRDISEDKLEILRLVSGLNYLWGENDWSLLEGLEKISTRYDNVTCTRLIESYVINLHELSEGRELARETKNIKYKVEISTCNDELVCPECAKIAKKKYPITGEIPELPYIYCKNGCRCSYTIDVGI